ncbi:MAG: glycosyl hydrolase 53 family protein [Sphingobacteriales bacterium]|nr:glycosyl hydrolase 53 family protein [Sphingobacteriales bacterium]
MKKYLLTILMLSCLITVNSSCKKSTAVNPPDSLPKQYYSFNQFVMGADLSYVNQVEDYGGRYKDSGVQKDPYLIMKNHGCNLVRVRLWHHPTWLAPLNAGRLYSDLYDAEKTIRRAKNAGMAVNLDLHYSDTWADPGTQQVPAAWSGLNLLTLKDSVYNYTLAVLNYLKSKNLTPEMIQIGNETNQGMLWPVGKTSGSDFSSFAVLLKSGIKAVRDFSVGSTIKPQIILHVAQLQNADYWAANLITAAGVTDFDVLGLSHYSKWGTINAMADITSTISRLKTTYGKKVMIVETAYPFTTQNADSYSNLIAGDGYVNGYPISEAGQYQYMKDLTQAIISGGGTGIMYWEPAWISSSLHDLWGTGSSWDNCTLFDFSSNGLPALDYMNYPYRF